MSGKKIVFFGNCQMMNLYRTYVGHVVPDTEDEVTYYPFGTDIARKDIAARFAEADIVVKMVFDTPDERPLDFLRPDVRLIPVPNMRGDFLWPFGARKLHPRSDTFHPLVKSYYGGETGDAFLNRMIVRNVEPRTAVDKYLQVDFKRQHNIERVFELTLEMQRRRDAQTDIRVADFLESNFRKTKLFNTAGHPSDALLHQMYRQALAQIDSAIDIDRVLAGHSLGNPPWRMHPVHPGLIDAYGLTFINQFTRFPGHDEGYLTFEEYALRYMRGDYVLELRQVAKSADLDPPTALAMLDEALRKAPRSPMAHRLRSAQLLRLRRVDEAIDAAHKVLALEPGNPTMFIQVMNAYAAKRDFAMAEDVALQAIQKFPNNASIFTAMSGLQRGKGDWDSALQYAQFAMRLHPGDPYGISRVGALHMERGNYSEAERLARKAIKCAPSVEVGHKLLIDTLEAQGRRQDAIDDMRDFIASVRPDVGMHTRFAGLLMRNQDFAEAELAYRKALRLKPTDATALRGRAEALDRMGRPAQAVAALREAIAAGGSDASLHGALAALLLRVDDLAGAEAAYREALALNPQGSTIHRALADLLDRQGRGAEAIHILREAAGSRAADASVLGALAALLTRQGDAQGAEAAYREAIRRSPASAGTAHRGLAETLDRQNRRAEAIKVLRDSLAAGSKDAASHSYLATLLARENDLGGAEQAYRQAIALMPTAPNLPRGLAEVLDRQGRRAEAITALRAAIASGAADGTSYGNLAALLARENDLAGAETAYREALRRTPTATSFLRGLSETLERQGRRGEAIGMVRDALASWASDAATHAHLAGLLIRDDDLQGAETAYQTALALSPGSVNLYRGLSETLERQGRRPDAIAVLRKAFDAGIADAATQAFLAAMLVRNGDQQGAETVYRQAIARDPRGVGAYRGLATLLNQQGRRREAAETLRQAIAVDPADASLHAFLGLLLAHGHDLQGAEAAYREALLVDPSPARTHRELAEVVERLGRRQDAIAILQRAVEAGHADAVSRDRLTQLLQPEPHAKSADTPFAELDMPVAGR